MDFSSTCLFSVAFRVYTSPAFCATRISALVFYLWRYCSARFRGLLVAQAAKFLSLAGGEGASGGACVLGKSFMHLSCRLFPTCHASIFTTDSSMDAARSVVHFQGVGRFSTRGRSVFQRIRMFSWPTHFERAYVESSPITVVPYSFLP